MNINETLFRHKNISAMKSCHLQIDIKDIMLGKISQREKDKYYMISCIREI